MRYFVILILKYGCVYNLYLKPFMHTNNLYFASDHAGYELKETLINFINEKYDFLQVNDEGAFEYDKGDDYPDFIKKAARAVSADPEKSKAIMLGHSGQGEAMVANRFENVRAALYYGGPEKILKLSRRHNDANVLSLGAGFLKETEAKEAVSKWLETSFSDDERHIRRITKIAEINE